MESAGEALVRELEKRSLPKIAGLWRRLMEGGCTLYVRSEEGHRPLDAYALHWVSRYLPATATDVEVVPVYDEIREISDRNLILFGRLRALGSEKLLSETGGEVIHEQGHFRAIDGERLLQVDTGEMWVRVERQKWVRDFGVLRLWQQPERGRVAINFSGLGPIGTLGTVLAITDLSRQAMSEVEARLPSMEDMQANFVEILVKAEREPKGDPIVVSPSEVSVRVERVFHAAADLNWPLMIFGRSSTAEGQVFEVRVKDTKEEHEKLLSRSQVEFAVLVAIARRTETEASMYARKGGYIGYEQIANSKEVREILHESTGLDVAVVRATIARLRRKLRSPEWDRAFPNLILTSRIRQEGSRKEIVVLRLRAKFKFRL